METGGREGFMEVLYQGAQRGDNICEGAERGRNRTMVGATERRTAKGECSERYDH